MAPRRRSGLHAPASERPRQPRRTAPRLDYAHPVEPASILYLPGLGADHRLFRPQLDRYGGEVAEWPEVDLRDGERRGLERFVATLLDDLHRRGRWRGRLLVGFSFGGQIALSLARLACEQGLPAPGGLLLLSAPRRTEQITRRFRRQVAAAAWIPGGLLRWAARTVVAPRFGRVCGLDASQQRELQRMAAALDPNSFRRLARIAAAWSFDAADEARLSATPIRHLHATLDPVIPPPPESLRGVVPIAGTAHLLPWTHADRVAEAIEALGGVAAVAGDRLGGRDAAA